MKNNTKTPIIIIILVFLLLLSANYLTPQPAKIGETIIEVRDTNFFEPVEPLDTLG